MWMMMKMEREKGSRVHVSVVTRLKNYDVRNVKQCSAIVYGGLFASQAQWNFSPT